VTFWSALLVRWLGLAATAVLIGGLVVERLVLEAGGADGGRRRLGRWRVLAIAVLVVTTAGELVLRAHAMTDAGLAESVAAVPLVLSRTHFGAIWIARTALLGALAAAAFRGRRSVTPGLALACAVALTTALTGHADDRGDVSVGVLLDWVHVVAASAWIGGLAMLTVAVLPSARADEPRAVAAAGRRFSRLAGWCLVTVVVTGAYNAWVQLPGITALWETVYGRMLLGKIIVVAIVAALGALNRFVMLPLLSAPGAFVYLVRSVGSETALAVVVLALTAALGESTPARHEGHIAHVTEVEEGHEPMRASMEHLHAQGGVPPGWVFRPVPGDPARGRRVFARLECFRCHRLEGEGFPEPTRPGPDLTGMARHHPGGYMAESIVNPNAVIVEGPGYTGRDGRSTMPEYREELTVGELADIVTYLQTVGGQPRGRER
jgi:putative copper export protein/mono/diheme cytochrome c family protein